MLERNNAKNKMRPLSSFCLDAQLVAMNTLSVQNLRPSTFKRGQVDRLRRALLGVIQDLPEPVAEQRLHLAAVLLHGLVKDGLHSCSAAPRLY